MQFEPNMPSEASLEPLISLSRVYKIGELAEMTDSTTRTLRYYEELGLLKAVRNDAGQRLYDDEGVARLRFINELKSGGFSLLEIRDFFKSWQGNDTGAEAAAQTLQIVQTKMAEIAELQAKLNRLNSELRAMVNYLVACKTCERTPSENSCLPCDRHHTHERAPAIIANLLKNKVNLHEPKSV